MSEGFEYGNARARARRADLLIGARYQELVDLDLEHFLATLSDTPYRPDLVAATPRYRGRRLLDEALRTNLARNLQDLVSWYDGAAGTTVALIVARWDLRNVRTVLRGQYARADPGEIRAALVPAGALRDDVLGELSSQPGIRAAVDLMVSWGVPTQATARAVAGAMEDFESSADFQALERAMNQAEADQVRPALDGAGREVARILRAEIDQANLLVALRLHEARSEGQEWDAVSPAQRFLSGGTVPAAVLARAGRAEDRAAATAVLAEATTGAMWWPALDRWSESGDLAALGDELDETLTRTAVGMFATADPLGPGVPLAYAWAKENEVENLRTIGAGLAAGAPPHLIEEDLVILS